MLWRMVKKLESLNTTSKLVNKCIATYSDLWYRGGAEAGITNYSHSCHKAFKSRGEAEDFIEEYKITAGLLRAESMEEDASSNLSEQLDQLRLSKDSEAADWLLIRRRLGRTTPSPNGLIKGQANYIPSFLSKNVHVLSYDQNSKCKRKCVHVILERLAILLFPRLRI